MRYKLLGYLLLVLLLAAIVSLTLVWQAGHRPIPAAVIHQNGQSGQIQTYKSTYGFAFDYPAADPIKEEPVQQGSDPYMSQGIQLVRLDIPKTDYPNTNFNEAWLSAGIGLKMSETDCYKYLGNADAMVPMTATQTINGIKFHTATFSGAGAGNFYDTRLYRVYANSTCYEVSLNIHTSNIQNYDPASNIHEVNQIDVWSKLDAILQTYNFSDIVCGGFAGLPCPTTGYKCEAEGNFPDAATICKKEQQ